ncbi:DUF4013 domain-containing protein [Methanoregula sp.]|uniref:DUF4013 domain-containing protein n=1 Tax=Methanoregula sp. TaxID=2052170 RepID=UPI003C77CD8A
MDYTEIVRDALAYARQGVFEKKSSWMRLILATILIAIPMNGYLMRIYRGETPAPEIDRWGRLCIDGLKLMIVGLIWSIPILVIWTVTYGSLVEAVLSGNLHSAVFTSWTPNMGLLLLMYLFEIVVGILLPVASIRFARSNRFAEAFNFRAIVDHIGKIGWLGYILGLIIVAVLVAVPIMALVCIFVLIGIMAGLLTGFSLAAIFGIIIIAILVILLISPVFVVFQARYWTRLYDSTAQAAE